VPLVVTVLSEATGPTDRKAQSLATLDVAALGDRHATQIFECSDAFGVDAGIAKEPSVVRHLPVRMPYQALQPGLLVRDDLPSSDRTRTEHAPQFVKQAHGLFTPRPILSAG
jgi:hypothetical protein